MTLNPYDPSKVSGSILELEKENFARGEQVQLFAWAISAKRYCLFEDTGVSRRIRKASQHGLGHLLNPTDPRSEDREWIKRFWGHLLAVEFGERPPDLPWLDLPALSRITISSPAMLKPFAALNSGREYLDQIKPHNFVLSAHVSPLGQPTGFDPDHFHLIAPFESDPTEWLGLEWTERYSNSPVPVTTQSPAPPQSARLETYRAYLETFRHRTESKSAASDGSPCRPDTRGLLQRRHIRAGQVEYIGKESNRWEEAEKGIIQDPSEAVISYGSDDYEWVKARPQLHDHAARELAEAGGVTERWIKEIRSGRREPSTKLKARLITFLS